MYAKGRYAGIVFAEFGGSFDRDRAVELLRVAGLRSGSKQVWANQDRAAPERAARNFCFGLKRILKKEWEVPYAISITDEAPYVVTVGGEHALTANVTKTGVEYDWKGEWASWDELHQHAMIVELKTKCARIVSKAAAGMKGQAKGGSKGGPAQGQAAPH